MLRLHLATAKMDGVGVEAFGEARERIGLAFPSGFVVVQKEHHTPVLFAEANDALLLFH
jgi:hypothetical protein